ncbi:RING-type E3 ubiquitin transferase [Salvia divinorum]|uniref:RING-type E3 ubiquitin transferase n=1 Tax=Salvia divinorum TaxID=28513 RepID=A0ABD1HPC0_SALDI
MDGETNQDDSFPESLDSPEVSPDSSVDCLASDGSRLRRHGGSNEGTSNVQEQTLVVPEDGPPVVTEENSNRLVEDVVQHSDPGRSTASRSSTTPLSASSSGQVGKLGSSSGVGRVLSGRFTFKSDRLVKNVVQNYVPVRCNDPRRLANSISLSVSSSDQQRNRDSTRRVRFGSSTWFRDSTLVAVEGRHTLVPGNQQRIRDDPMSTGLSQEQIRSGLKERKHTMDCAICLEDYVEGDDLGILDCEHYFHKSCITKWLLQNNKCPICIRKALETD